MKMACPTCERSIEAGEESFGQVLNCPGCGSPMLVPKLAVVPTVASPMQSPVVPRTAAAPSKLGSFLRYLAFVAIMAVVGYVWALIGGKKSSATDAAWKRLQSVNYVMRTQNHVLPSVMFQWAAQQYVETNNPRIDRSLQAFIGDAVQVFRAVAAGFKPLDDQTMQLAGFTNSMAEMGAVLGSENRSYYQPQGTPEAGAMLMGFFGALAAQGQAQELQAKYDEVARSSGLDVLLQRADALRDELSRRYGQEFVRFW